VRVTDKQRHRDGNTQRKSEHPRIRPCRFGIDCNISGHWHKRKKGAPFTGAAKRIQEAKADRTRKPEWELCETSPSECSRTDRDNQDVQPVRWDVCDSKTPAVCTRSDHGHDRSQIKEVHTANAPPADETSEDLDLAFRLARLESPFDPDDDSDASTITVMPDHKHSSQANSSDSGVRSQPGMPGPQSVPQVGVKANKPLRKVSRVASTQAASGLLLDGDTQVTNMRNVMPQLERVHTLDEILYPQSENSITTPSDHSVFNTQSEDLITTPSDHSVEILDTDEFPYDFTTREHILYFGDATPPIGCFEWIARKFLNFKETTSGNENPHRTTDDNYEVSVIHRSTWFFRNKWRMSFWNHKRRNDHIDLLSIYTHKKKVLIYKALYDELLTHRDLIRRGVMNHGQAVQNVHSAIRNVYTSIDGDSNYLKRDQQITQNTFDAVCVELVILNCKRGFLTPNVTSAPFFRHAAVSKTPGSQLASFGSTVLSAK
jgi:hypothetical protein